MAPGEWKRRVATYTVKQSDLDAGSIPNTASLGSTGPGGAALPTLTSSFVVGEPVEPPCATAEQRMREHVAGLAKPVGSLGRLEDLAVWIGACQDACVRPRPLDVVPGEPPVEVGGEAECGEGIGWAVHEAPAPQAGGLVSHDPPPGVSRSRRGGPAWRGGSHRRPSA